ncbi:MAG: hypothetical protein JWN24_3033 [Phycisphaerales bacterium]|nr:hypothetical protein [Phycisphaerales bacterium]
MIVERLAYSSRRIGITWLSGLPAGRIRMRDYGVPAVGGVKFDLAHVRFPARASDVKPGVPMPKYWCLRG